MTVPAWKIRAARRISIAADLRRGMAVGGVARLYAIPRRTVRDDEAFLIRNGILKRVAHKEKPGQFRYAKGPTAEAFGDEPNMAWAGGGPSPTPPQRGGRGIRVHAVHVRARVERSVIEALSLSSVKESGASCFASGHHDFGGVRFQVQARYGPNRGELRVYHPGVHVQWGDAAGERARQEDAADAALRSLLAAAGGRPAGDIESADAAHFAVKAETEVRVWVDRSQGPMEFESNNPAIMEAVASLPEAANAMAARLAGVEASTAGVANRVSQVERGVLALSDTVGKVVDRLAPAQAVAEDVPAFEAPADTWEGFA